MKGTIYPLGPAAARLSQLGTVLREERAQGPTGVAVPLNLNLVSVP